MKYAVILVIVIIAAALFWFSKPDKIMGVHHGHAFGAVVLLHDHGANPKDMERMVTLLHERDPRWVYYLPAAPHKTERGWSWYGSYRSDTIDIEKKELKKRIVQARQKVESEIDKIEGLGIPRNRIYVGGFSQGATVALDYVLNAGHVKQPAGLIFMSGSTEYVFGAGRSSEKIDLAPLSGRRPLKVFIAHGRDTTSISQGKLEEFASILSRYGHHVEMNSFNSGYVSSPELVNELSSFLGADR